MTYYDVSVILRNYIYRIDRNSTIHEITDQGFDSITKVDIINQDMKFIVNKRRFMYETKFTTYAHRVELTDE